MRRTEKVAATDMAAPGPAGDEGVSAGASVGEEEGEEEEGPVTLTLSFWPWVQCCGKAQAK